MVMAIEQAEVAEREPLRLSDETFAVIAALSAMSRVIDPDGALNRHTTAILRAAAGMADVELSTRETVLEVARIMEAGHG